MFSRDTECPKGTQGGALIFCLLAAVALLTGCPTEQQLGALPPPMTLDQVVEILNANNTQLSSFKAAVQDVGGELVSRDGEKQGLGLLGLRGLLLYSQPQQVRMELIKSEKRVGWLGSNDRLYWMWHQTGLNDSNIRCYVGEHQKWNPAVGRNVLPVNPLELAHLLGVDVIGTGGAIPVIRQSDPAERATIVQFIGPLPGRGGLLLRELWVSRDPPVRPQGVRVYDERGQVIVRSWLNDWKPIKNREALFPHDVTIQWYIYDDVAATNGRPSGVVRRDGSRLTLDFAAVEADPKYANAQIYQYECPPNAQVIQLDGPRQTPVLEVSD